MAKRMIHKPQTNREKYEKKNYTLPGMNTSVHIERALAFDLSTFYNTCKEQHGFTSLSQLVASLIRCYLQAERGRIPGEAEPSYEKYALTWEELGIGKSNVLGLPEPNEVMKRMLGESAVPTMDKLPLSERPRLHGHFTKEYMEGIDPETYSQTDYMLDLIWIPEMCGGFTNGFFDGEEEWEEHIQQYIDKGYGKMWFPYNDRGFMSNWQNGDQLAHEGVFMDAEIVPDTGNKALAIMLHNRIADWEKIWPRYRDKDESFVDQERIFLEAVRDSEERERIVSNRDMSLEEIEEIVGVKRKRESEGEDSA